MKTPWVWIIIVIFWVGILCTPKTNVAIGADAELPLPIPVAPQTATYSFCVADYNKDGTPDLWCIKRTNTGSGHTEIHIIDGKNPKHFLFQSETVLAETPESSH